MAFNMRPHKVNKQAAKLDPVFAKTHNYMTDKVGRPIYDKIGGFEGARKKIEGAIGISKDDISSDMSDTVGEFYHNTGPTESAFRGDQAQLIQALQARLNGNTPSMTDVSANNQRQAGLANLMAMRASNRGGSAGMNARSQMMAGNQLNTNINQQAQVGNMQEMLNNQNMLAQALQQARGQDQAFQQLDQQNLLARAGAQTNAAMNNQNLNAQNQMQANQLRWENAKKQMESGDKLLGGMGAMFGASDERAKDSIEDIKGKDLNEFFKAIKPKKYKYTEPEKPGRQPGERLGFMIQDIQKTKLGKKIVRQHEDGTLMYDKDNLQGILIAELSRRAKEKN